jgi:hypothetical protein
VNYLQFIASLIHSLAWPAAVIVLAALFRKPLKALLLNLSRFKYGNVEINFRHELAQIEAYAKTIDLKPVPRQISSEPRTAEQILNEAARLIDDFPEPAIALAWTAVEHELKSAATRLGLPSDYHSSGRYIDALQRHGYLDKETHEILRRIQNLRNMAVHGGAAPATISSDEAREFVALTAAIVQRLKEIAPRSTGR